MREIDKVRPIRVVENDLMAASVVKGTVIVTSALKALSALLATLFWCMINTIVNLSCKQLNRMKAIISSTWSSPASQILRLTFSSFSKHRAALSKKARLPPFLTMILPTYAVLFKPAAIATWLKTVRSNPAANLALKIKLVHFETTAHLKQCLPGNYNAPKISKHIMIRN